MGLGQGEGDGADPLAEGLMNGGEFRQQTLIRSATGGCSAFQYWAERLTL